MGKGVAGKRMDHGHFIHMPGKVGERVGAPQPRLTMLPK